ncbi:MAG TPA: hypothetical protein VLS48_00570 [Anaerolineales bacterium]|nr:hypothetical protein [Anaerolineales bacterium]
MNNCYFPFKRRLYGWEIEQARLVFGDMLDYAAVQIHECNPWPNRVDRLGRWMKTRFAQTPPGDKTDIAITLGNRILFPVRLPEQRGAPGQKEHVLFCWLMHELTHVWQYQQTGVTYLFKAFSAQMRGGYAYGGAEKLRAARAEGKDLWHFNFEQQGDIVRDYYHRVTAALDVTDWADYITRDIQKRA